MTSPLFTLVAIVGIVLSAKLAGAIARRLRLPEVWGQVALGVAAGPAALDLWTRAPAIAGGRVTQTIEIVALLAHAGLLLTMYLAGLHSPWRDVVRLAPATAAAGGGALLLGGVAGFLLTFTLGSPVAAALLVAACFAAPGLAVSFGTEGESGEVARDENAVALGAGWLAHPVAAGLLAAAVGLHGGRPPAGAAVAGLTAVGKGLAFYVAAALIAYVLAPRLAFWNERWDRGAASVWPGWIAGLLFAWGSEYLGGLHAVAGAYLMGSLQGGAPNRVAIAAQARSLGHALLFPIFFVSLGAELRLPATMSAGFLVPLLIAFLARAAGAAASLRLGGVAWRDALRVATALSPLGEVGLAVAGAGLMAGVINQEQFALLTVAAVGSTLLVPPALRWAWPR